MGNIAILKAEGNNNKAVYLHWNGGRDSVEAFLKYCELRGFRGFEDDYGMARFCQVVSNFFGADGLNIGITDHVESCGDNGVYIIKGWEIVGREDFTGREQRTYDLQEMLIEIDKAQPVKQQLGEYLESEEVPTSTLKVNDMVYLMDHTGEVKKYTVAGFGEDRYINGIKVLGIPYVNKYLNDGLYSENINNYIREKSVRLVTKQPIEV
ncbi:hypothetical protein NST17_19595 [Caldifermentibacillus hisashii]|uniref:YopX protein domain-containing protein n=1 Tax=Caldifermentibacillus hisashii TaxID=996558 RepID=A0ABU9K3M9_9BACI